MSVSVSVSMSVSISVSVSDSKMVDVRASLTRPLRLLEYNIQTKLTPWEQEEGITPSEALSSQGSGDRPHEIFFS